MHAHESWSVLKRPGSPIDPIGVHYYFLMGYVARRRIQQGRRMRRPCIVAFCWAPRCTVKPEAKLQGGLRGARSNQSSACLR
jgi:hypothetical protein